MRRGRLAGVCAAALSIVLIGGQVIGAAPTRLLLIADFNQAARNMESVNTAGGQFGVWCVYQPCDCQQVFVPGGAVFDAEGYALKLVYSVTPPPHYNGWYSFLTDAPGGGVDFSGYDRLGLFVKGSSAFRLELKDGRSRDDGSPEGVVQFTVTDVSDEWMWVEIPFFMFEPKAPHNMIDWADIRQMVVVFSDTISEPDGWVMLDYLYAADGMLTF